MGSRWTERDIDRLRTWYPVLTISDLLVMFQGRSQDAILGMARKLELRKQYK